MLYTVSAMVIGLLVLEILKGFLPYMCMVAILVKWPGPFEQIFRSFNP